VALANIAQQAKDNAGIVNYAVRGAAAYEAVAKQPKPEGMSDADLTAKIKREQDSVQSSYDYLEGAAFNAIMNEQDPAARIKLVRQFTPAFPKTRYAAQVAQYAIISLLQVQDFAGLANYGEKAVKDNPDNAAVIVLVARGYSEDQKSPAHLQEAAVLAKRAIELAQADSKLTAEQKSELVGTAKSVLGWSLLRQDKAAAAIPELKEAAPLLKSNAVDYSTALYGLAFAYAKLNRLAEAKATLSEAVNVEGPYQQPARELLQKVNAAKPAAARRQ
jgi:tetratricopeptide (TPR) repeat protein